MVKFSIYLNKRVFVMLLFMKLFLKILSMMANSVDLDQTAPDLGLYCLHMPFCQKLWCTILGHLPS